MAVLVSSQRPIGYIASRIREVSIMEMHQVRYFLAVARTLNFTRAADDAM